MSEGYVGWRCGGCDEPITGRSWKCPHCGLDLTPADLRKPWIGWTQDRDIARAERLVAALREVGETAFDAIADDGAAPEYVHKAFRAAVCRLMAQWCREHGEDELATIFEREGG